MFGEKYIFLDTINKIDKKGRIILPSATGAEHGEILTLEIVKKAADETYIRVQQYKVIKKYLDLLNKKFEEAIDAKEKEYYLLQIEQYSQNLSAIVEVDKQRRINIPIELRKKYLKTDEAQIIGGGNTVLIRSRKRNSNE